MRGSFATYINGVCYTVHIRTDICWHTHTHTYTHTYVRTRIHSYTAKYLSPNKFSTFGDALLKFSLYTLPVCVSEYSLRFDWPRHCIRSCIKIGLKSPSPFFQNVILFNNWYFGFCLGVLIIITPRISVLDNKFIMRTIALNISKAFDKMWHPSLESLEGYFQLSSPWRSSLTAIHRKTIRSMPTFLWLLSSVLPSF